MASTSRCSVVAVPLQDNGVTVTRRAFLGGIIAVSAAACRPRRSARPGLVPDDRASVDSAFNDEQALLALYDQAIAQLDAVAAGPLTAARARHAAHLQALRDIRRPSPTATASPAPVAGPADRSTLTAALATSAGSLREMAVRADDGRLAAVLASIAAEHAADAAPVGGAR